MAVVAGRVVEEKGVLVIYGRGCCPGGGGCGRQAGGWRRYLCVWGRGRDKEEEVS